MSKNRGGRRGGYNPQDELAHEMRRTDDSATADAHALSEDKAAAQNVRGDESDCAAPKSNEGTLDDREVSLTKREEEIVTRESSVFGREKQLEERERELEKGQQELEALHIEVTNRETAVKKAEAARDEGYRLAKSEHDRQLQDDEERSKSEIARYEQEAKAKLSQELADIRKSHDAELQSELEAARASIASEREAWKAEYEQQKAALEASRAEIDKQRGALDAQQSEIDRKSEDFDLDQLGFQRRRERFMKYMDEQRDNLEGLVAERVQARKEEFDAREQESRNERERLLGEIQSQQALLSSYEELKRQLGTKTVQEVLVQLGDMRDEITSLNEDIANGKATEELRGRLADVESERDAARAKIIELTNERAQDRQRLLDYDELQFKLNEAEQQRKHAEALLKNAEGNQERLKQELDRYLAAYEKPKAREERIAEIERPFFVLDTEWAGDGSPQPGRPQKPKKGEQTDEIAWLNGIYNECEKYGLHFNKRLLRAFHTSLKTAEWSPLTVLAGVSGTGKSELPRLYSHFGGIYFASVPVQPNWDSKESMLGFFNSIDNRFDAEPILRFLAQSQRGWRDDSEDELGYPGLSDAVCMILLDEMNLAHPELYFAEFLSKFEERRGREGGDEPTIDVKLGTGMDPYQIALGRNMLWTGTMNQDETTKSLSDKVLDRSIVMYFPRPTELKRREKINPLNENNRGKILHINTWNSWKVKEAKFTDEEILPYKAFVEEMNEALGFVGRAIGHRVWQSVEYYMASYPDVRLSEQGSKERARAMHTAFEDQIVQKIMPKLRGIDTTGESEKKCIIPIKNLLLQGVNGSPFELDEDFELARRLGYGQFVWQSAEYLKKDPTEDINPEQGCESE